MNLRLTLTILISFLVAAILQFLPVPDVIASWVPQWVALVTIYWALVLDDNFKLMAACFIGLCLDVMNGSILGQHALALLWLSFIVIKNGRQLRRASRPQQLAEIGLLIIGYQFILFVLQGVLRQHLPDLNYFMSSFSSALIWPWVSIFLDDRCQRFIKLTAE